MQLTRARSALLGGLLLVLAVGLAAYVARGPAEGTERGPIVIGLLQALGGTTAGSERPQAAAVRLAVEEINAEGGLLGRPVELRVADAGTDARAAAVAAEGLIERERAVALFGCWTSVCREGAKGVVEARRHLLFYPLAYEGMEQSPNIIYTGPLPNQQALPAADWAMQRFGRRVFLVGIDGAYSQRMHAVLRDFIRLGGGEVVGEHRLQLGVEDMGTITADLLALRPELVISTFGGAINGAFFDALVAQGLAGTPLLSVRAAEPDLRLFGGGRLTRHYAAWSYLQSLPGAANEDFLARLRSSAGNADVGDPAVSAYLAVKLWAAAAREVDSVQTEAVNARVLAQAVPTPQGIAALDSRTRHLWRPLRIAQVQPDGGLREVLLLRQHIKPQPWPAFRTTEHWLAVLAQQRQEEEAP